MGEVQQRKVQDLATFGGIFTPEEGCKAVQQRAKLVNYAISALEAGSISEALGHDPLLIALSELGETQRSEIVIEAFISRCLGRSAGRRGEFTAADYRHTLRLVAGLLLSHCEFNPCWSQLLTWIGNKLRAWNGRE
jgi:hypothetical protein